MNRIVLPLVMGVSVLALLALMTPRAVANDETDDIEIRIQAPLEAVDCGAMTISVLGLAIDIHAASIVGADCEEGDNDDVDDPDEAEGEDDGECPLACEALEPGRSVGVMLSSDTTLAATEVRQGDELDEEDDDDGQEGDQEVEIEAPLQDIDGTAQTIHVLGLTVDVSNAQFAGQESAEADDGEDEHDCTESVDLSDLMVGQFVEVELASSQAPLIATKLEIENFTNQVEVEVMGSDGELIDHDGHSMNDLTVDVVTKASIPMTSTAGSSRRSHRVVRVHLHRSVGSGTFTLSGLPSGRAKLVVTRITGEGVIRGRSRVNVVANATVFARVRLKNLHTR